MPDILLRALQTPCGEEASDGDSAEAAEWEEEAAGVAATGFMHRVCPDGREPFMAIQVMDMPVHPEHISTHHIHRLKYGFVRL